jgi:Putative F0F1-ATPase subunit Ca2+/Mg2+ transporter
MGLDEHSGPKKQKPFNNYLKYSSLAMQMVVTIGVAGWLGHKTDLYFNFKFPVFLLSLVFLAFGGIMYKLYQSITKE